MTGQDWELGSGPAGPGAVRRRHSQQGQQHQQGQGGRAHHAHPGDLQSHGLLGDQLHPGWEKKDMSGASLGAQPHLWMSGWGEGRDRKPRNQDSQMGEEDTRTEGNRLRWVPLVWGAERYPSLGLWELCSEEGRRLTLAPTAPGKPGGPAGPVGPCE